ncbi:hypothetical protein [Streptomyces flavofungini]|uniref:hypothetical protein n=1 Tax=Streptomyces flavofungini TaxID=68200 RepID=UPI0025B017FC|nr:hypothetical protein [Streptomyces flavofungini]WJV47664.1 hypothetical protein QUY26_20320 [Streptomyces flavofungini]
MSQHNTPEPHDLTVAVDVARQLLADYAHIDHGDLFALNQAHGAIREALRILLRAVGAEPVTGRQTPPRCPAAHREDPEPCGGPVVVTVLDATGAGANGCEHHAARLLASLTGGRVYALGTSPEASAIRVFQAAASLRPFAWLTDAPRTEPSQLSHAENSRGGEGR